MNTALLFTGLLVAALALAPSDARAARAAGAAATAGTTGKPAATPAPEAPPPRSTFVIDSQFGKDPFFPKTTRLGRAPARTNEVVTTNPSQFSDNDIRIAGFSNQRGRIIVILNGKSIEKGEKIDLNIRGQRLPVRCIDVTERTILLEINGVTKELNIPANNVPAPTQ